MRMTRRPPAPARALAVALALAVAVAATLVGAAPASARVRFTRTTITVMTGGGRAVITRDPFHIAFTQADGRPALSEDANRAARPLPETAVQDPIAPGVDNPRTPTVYAPLSFLVGTEQIQQYGGGLWGGNLLAGTRSGVLYSARRVLSAAPGLGGVRLTLSTDDPTGRRLLVTVAPRPRGGLGVLASASPSLGVVEIGDSFASSAGEAFFGLGGRHNAIDQHGQVLSDWVSEENLNFPSRSTQLYPNGPTAAYYPVPELYSSRPYGFLLDQPELSRFKLDVGGARSWNVMADASTLNYVVAPGSAPRAIGVLTRYSGREPVPPRWGLGPMLDRLVKNVGETEADYGSEVTSDLANIAAYRLPLTAYRIEGWGLDGPNGSNDGLSLHTFMSVAAQASAIATLRARGIHPLVYLRPWVTPDSLPVLEGLVVRTALGTPYYTTGTGGQPIALLDFTNPAAVRWWQAEVAKALDLGADGFMQDFGEEVLDGMHFADGQTGATMHNVYPTLAAQATREEFSAYAHQHPGRGGLFFFTRAGSTGAAAYTDANFPGDETTDWSHSSGLASLTSDMLGRAVTGAYGYATDIGGYYDLTTPPTSEPLFLRWAEWAALSPVFRLHGSGLAGTHTPWSYGPATVRTYIALSKLHLRAVPLIMRLWRAADRTGMPVTRPLWLQYPTDRRTYDQDQEWLLGPDVLVAPVVVQGAVSRRVYFPAGCWRAPSGRVWRGPRSAAVAAPLTVLPYFTRCATAPFRRGS